MRTQLDQLLAKYRSAIEEKYGLRSSGGRSSAPVIKAVHFVSSTDKNLFTGPTGIEQLYDSIYDIAGKVGAPKGEH